MENYRGSYDIPMDCSYPRNSTGLHWAPEIAPPWRFSAGGRASVSGIASGECVQRAPRSQVIVPGGRGPEPPGARGYEPPPQDATPRSASRTVSRNARHPSEDGIIYHPRTRMSILTIGLAKK